MYRACGPWSAVSRVCRPGPSTSSSAASTRTTSRWSGTTMRAPRPASTAARAASASSHGQSRPVVGGGHRQQGCRRRPTRSDVRQERGPGRIGRPGLGLPGWQGGVLGRLDGQGLLGRGVPRWDRQPQDVPERAGVPRRDEPGRRQHVGREHRLRRDDPAQRAQPAGVLGGGAPLEDEPVEVLAREPHLDAHARHGGRRHRRGHRVLEGAVQVGQPGVHLHERDRQVVGRRVVAGEPARAGGGPGGEEGQLLAVRLRPLAVGLDGPRDPSPLDRRHGSETSGGSRRRQGRPGRAVDGRGVRRRRPAGAPRPGRCAPR